MSAAVVLDASPLGILSHPRNPPPVAACRQWLVNLSAAGRRVIVPEIADYEVRRELIRLGSQNALINLDQLAAQLEYVPLTTVAMRLAAELWAQARRRGTSSSLLGACCPPNSKERETPPDKPGGISGKASERSGPD